MQLLTLAVALIVITVSLRVRRRMLLALSWPAVQDYYAFKARVYKYLRHAGWKMEHRNESDYQFIARRDGRKFVVKCISSDIQLTPMMIKDSARLYLTSPSDGVVIITAAVQPNNVLHVALEQKVRVSHYKAIASFPFEPHAA
jgi:hypothetical protein